MFACSVDFVVVAVVAVVLVMTHVYKFSLRKFAEKIFTHLVFGREKRHAIMFSCSWVRLGSHSTGVRLSKMNDSLRNFILYCLGMESKSDNHDGSWLLKRSGRNVLFCFIYACDATWCWKWDQRLLAMEKASVCFAV